MCLKALCDFAEEDGGVASAGEVEVQFEVVAVFVGSGGDLRLFRPETQRPSAADTAAFV